MLGLPFGISTIATSVNYPVFFLACAIMIAMIAAILYLPARISQYSLLFATILGWIIYSILFTPPQSTVLNDSSSITWMLFPLGQSEEINLSIVITAILVGILNTSNTFGAMRGTDIFYTDKLNVKSRYRRSFMTSGFMTICAAPLGIVPFSPFVSSIGLITQTKDSSRISFSIGSLIFLLIGSIAFLTDFFRALPLAIGSAVMLVTYLPLLFSSLSFVKEIELNPRNIYRLALPLFIGIFLMAAPKVVIESLPPMFSSLFGNGLLMGILLALILENSINWDKITPQSSLKDG